MRGVEVEANVHGFGDRRGAKVFPVTRLTTALCPAKYREPLPMAPPVPLELSPAECAVQDLLESIYVDFVAPPLETASTAQQFIDKVVAIWDDYGERLRALDTFVSITKDGPFVSRLRSRSAALQQDLEDFAMSLAGDTARHEVEFATSTVMRAQRLCVRINAMGPPSDLNEDRRLCMGFHGSVALYTYATACLWAIRGGVKYHGSDVLMTVFGMLTGGAVDAYGFARNAMRLREADMCDVGPPIAMDDEDRSILDEHISDAEKMIAQIER
jgi:hypothetical protein